MKGTIMQTGGIHLQRGRRGEQGQAMLELALVMPVIVLLVFGALEIGRLFNAWIVVTQAAREGARVAAAECALNASCATHVDSTVDNSMTGFNLANRTVTLSPGPYAAGSPVTVTVDYRISFITPYIGALIPGSPFTLTSSTTMRLE